MTRSRTIDNFEQRLIDLEIALEREYKNGFLTQSEHLQKLKRLEQARAEIEKLIILGSFENDRGNGDNELGIPQFAVRTDGEQQLFKNFFAERLKLARKLYDKLQRINQWSTQALLMQCRPWTMILRLSILHRSLQELERLQLKAGNQNFLTDRQVNSLVESIQKTLKHRNIGPNLNGLISIFTEMDQCASRVAKLKTTVYREEQIVNEMKQWLQQQEKIANNQPKAQKPPDIDAIAALEREHAPGPLHKLINAKDRLALARNFIKTYQQRKTATQTDADMASTRLVGSRAHGV